MIDRGKQMKKNAARLIAYMIIFTMLLSVFVTYGTLTVSAAGTNEAGVTLPEFTPPSKTYRTLEEYDFSIEEIREALLKDTEYVFVDGRLRIKSVGEEEFVFYNYNYDKIDVELIGGYYYVDISEESFERGFYAYHYGPDKEWVINFEGSLDRAIITLNSIDDDAKWHIDSYPEDGWGGQVYISYDIYGGVEVENLYTDGVLERHTLDKNIEGDVDINVSYSVDGMLLYVNVYVDDSWHYYYPEDGWTDVPSGFEDKDGDYFTEMLPSVFHCTHEWQAPDCITPEYCTLCSEINSGALGHTWDNVEGKDVCTVCGEKKMVPFVAPEVSFEGIMPVKNLNDVTLPLEEIRGSIPSEINVSYKDGLLTLTVWEDSSVYALVKNTYRSPIYSENGKCIFDISENERADTRMQISLEGDQYYLDVEYDAYGKLTGAYSISFGERDDDGEYIEHGYVEEHTAFGATTVYYYDDPENINYSYKDVYKDGIFCEREVTYYYNDDDETELEIRYNAKGEVIYIEAEENDVNVYYNFENKCWSNGRNYYSPVAAPKMAVDKTVEQLLAICPSGLDFVESDVRESNGILAIVLTAVGAVILICGAAVGGYLFGKKRTK